MTGRLAVGREPRGIALSPDGSRLLVGNARSRRRLAHRRQGLEGPEHHPDRRRQPPAGGHQRRRQDGLHRQHEEPRVRHDPEQHRPGLGARPAADARAARRLGAPIATLSLDTQGKAASDAHGVAVSHDEQVPGRQLRRHARGHDLPDRPEAGSPGGPNSSRDLIAPELLKNDGRFRRVALGGRPTELAFAPDGKTLYVANYLADAVQVVDAEAGTTGPDDSPGRAQDARRSPAGARSCFTTRRARTTSGTVATPATATATPTASTSTRSTTAGRT